MSIGGKAWHEIGYEDVDTGGIKWKDLEQLLQLDEKYNRIDRGNAFGGWEYDPETKSQEYVAKSPGMIAAQERMDRRLGGEGFEKYEAPSQISAMTDALMAERMQKMGLIDEGTADLKQDEYGTRFADRSGSPTIDSTTPPPGSVQPPDMGVPTPPQPNPPGVGDRPPPAGVEPGTPPPVMKPGIPPTLPQGMTEEEWMQIQAMQGM